MPRASRLRCALTLRGGSSRSPIAHCPCLLRPDCAAAPRQLTKPVTWVPLIWGVLCGAAARRAPRSHPASLPCCPERWEPRSRFPLPAPACQRRVHVDRRGHRQGAAVHDHVGAASHRLHAGDQRLLRPGDRRDQRAVPAHPFRQNHGAGGHHPGAAPPAGEKPPRQPSPGSDHAPPVPHSVAPQFSVLLAGGLAVAYILDVWCGHEFPIVFALAVRPALGPVLRAARLAAARRPRAPT